MRLGGGSRAGREGGEGGDGGGVCFVSMLD
jgi:hypothetical protein